MPFIAGPVALAAFNAGAPLVVANAIVGVGVAGTVLYAAGSVALTVGASYAVAKLTAPKIPKPSDGQVEFKQPIPARFFYYGRGKYSGPVALYETQEGDLNKITLFGTRELEEIEKFYSNGTDISDLIVPTVIPGVTTIPEAWDSGGSHGFINIHIGLDDQEADAGALIYFSLGWTEDHRLRGCPYAYARMDSGSQEDFTGAFGSGVPEFSIVGGVKVYDPRKDTTNGGSGSHRMSNPDTWEFSDNQRLCTLDWITWPEGYAKDWARIDWATWVPQIAMADENVPLRAGGTEKRYRVATKVSYDEPRSRVLHRLMQAGDQTLFTTADGKIGSRGGVWQAPTVSLAVERFPEASFTHGVGMMDRINEFQLSAMLPERDYSEFDLAPWVNADDPEHAVGIVRRAPLELTQVPSNAQAQRLAKIYMKKRNPRWTGQVRTGFAALDAIGQAAINLSFDELDQPAGNFDGPFFVDGKISFLADKTGITFPVSSADPDAYDWDEAVEEEPIPGDVPVDAIVRLLAEPDTMLRITAASTNTLRVS